MCIYIYITMCIYIYILYRGMLFGVTGKRGPPVKISPVSLSHTTDGRLVPNLTRSSLAATKTKPRGTKNSAFHYREYVRQNMCFSLIP